MTDDMGCFIGSGAAKRLRPKLGDEADNPTYIFAEPRVGYRMPKGESPDERTE